jgi:hypothetical protein
LTASIFETIVLGFIFYIAAAGSLLPPGASVDANRFEGIVLRY